MTNRMWPLAVVGLVLVPIAACGNEPSRPPSSGPPVSLAAPSETKANPPTEAVLNAYRGMWTAYIEAGRTTNPRYQDLERYAEGDALNALKAGLESGKQKGLITKGNITMNPRVLELTPTDVPDTAKIRDCLDTTGASLVKASPGGTPYTDSPGGRRDVTATARNRGGAWKVVSFVPLDVGTC